MTDPLAIDVAITDDSLRVTLADGRELAAPLAWFPDFGGYPRAAREWRLIGRGHGLHWPELDEDISVASLLRAT